MPAYRLQERYGICWQWNELIHVGKRHVKVKEISAMKISYIVVNMIWMVLMRHGEILVWKYLEKCVLWRILDLHPSTLESIHKLCHPRLLNLKPSSENFVTASGGAYKI